LFDQRENCRENAFVSKRLAVAVMALVATGASAQAGDPVAGQKGFARCGVCHAVGPGAAKKLGPQLNGLIGRKAGSLPDFTYSPAMKASGIVWNQKTLDAYLLAPAKLVPGNKMAFPGLPVNKDRADLIAYLAGFKADGSKK
jgi:cytochrome c